MFKFFAEGKTYHVPVFLKTPLWYQVTQKHVLKISAPHMTGAILSWKTKSGESMRVAQITQEAITRMEFLIILTLDSDFFMVISAPVGMGTWVY